MVESGGGSIEAARDSVESLAWRGGMHLRVLVFTLGSFLLSKRTSKGISGMVPLVVELRTFAVKCASSVSIFGCKAASVFDSSGHMSGKLLKMDGSAVKPLCLWDLQPHVMGDVRLESLSFVPQHNSPYG